MWVRNARLRQGNLGTILQALREIYGRRHPSGGVMLQCRLHNRGTTNTGSLALSVFRSSPGTFVPSATPAWRPPTMLKEQPPGTPPPCAAPAGQPAA